jgi:hypothetical protein
MRGWLLSIGSVALTSLVIGNAYYQKQQFYPSVVYITKSNPSLAVRYTVKKNLKAVLNVSGYFTWIINMKIGEKGFPQAMHDEAATDMDIKPLYLQSRAMLSYVYTTSLARFLFYLT